MMITFKTIATAFALLTAAAAGAQENPSGTVTYALPQTVISLEVEAVQESFHAGPYARFASKYLGIDARQEDKISYQLTDVRLTPCIEADQSARYTVTLPSKGGNNFLQLTSQGLISTADGSFGQESAWRFPVMTEGGFAERGISSNFTSGSSTLYRNSNEEEAGRQLAVSQDILVAKTDEQKAREAADMILMLRKTRIAIVTGDTDANYSGESMGSAVSEITRLEKEYLSLFIGYSEYQTQKVSFDVIPHDDTRNHVYVAFRISDSEGLVSADNISGKPYMLDIVSEGVNAAGQNTKGSAKGSILYRVPAVCSVKLTDGVNLLLQTRIPIYQFGITSSYPVSQ